LRKTLGEPQSRSGHFGEKKNPLICQGIEEILITQFENTWAYILRHHLFNVADGK
jgi:hypothetical protein